MSFKASRAEPAAVVRDQVEEYERSGGKPADTLLAVITLTTRGSRSGKVRKMPLMWVEHTEAAPPLRPLRPLRRNRRSVRPTADQNDAGKVMR